MSGPVTTDHLIQGVVKWLQGFPDVTAVVGAFADNKPYLFQTNLWVTMEGTQSTAAVLYRAGGWAGPNQHNTMRFPRLGLEVYADPIRDNGNNVTDPGEAGRRIEAAYKAIDTRLHRSQGGTQMWGTVRTLGCTRLGEPDVLPVKDGGGLLVLTAFYGVSEA
jgi:hypothetical protein